MQAKTDECGLPAIRQNMSRGNRECKAVASPSSGCESMMVSEAISSQSTRNRNDETDILEFCSDFADVGPDRHRSWGEGEQAGKVVVFGNIFSSLRKTP